VVTGFIGYTTIININYVAVVDMELSTSIGSLIITAIILSLFAIFDWFCYQLVRSVKSGSALSETSISTADNFKNICLVLTVLLTFWMVAQVMDAVFEVNSKFFNFRKYFLGYCGIALITTSVYLCIMYPSILKRHNLGITDTIDKIGTED
jgi:hypothetical protein